LLGWGVLIPVSIYIPFWFIETCQIHNRFVNLPAATVATSVTFRCIEAMYDTTSPKDIIEDNLTNFVTYHFTLTPLVWDEKTKVVRKVTGKEVLALVTEVFTFFIATSVLLSYLLAFDFQPFESTVRLNDFTISDPALYTVNHFLNSYLYTWLLYFTLKVGFEAGGLGENAKGNATHKVFREPFVKSGSPTEFWTQRWNSMIHKLLKGGVFRPARKFLPTKVAVYLTFLMSGLYHDYVWQCIFYNVSSKNDENGNCVVPDDDPTACYRPIFGRVTCFFAYIGLGIMLERPLKKLAPVRWISEHLPTFVIAQMLLFVHLPVVHWYVCVHIKLYVYVYSFFHSENVYYLLYDDGTLYLFLRSLSISLSFYFNWILYSSTAIDFAQVWRRLDDGWVVQAFFDCPFSHSKDMKKVPAALTWCD
jgi:hypothetical protein